MTDLIVSDDEDQDAGGKLEVLDPTGHFEVRWGKKKSEIETAEKTFNDLLAKGYAAFKKTFTGRKGKAVDSFDPKAGTLIFDEGEAKKLPTVEDKGEISHEKTTEFDKKADTVLVPPIQGG